MCPDIWEIRFEILLFVKDLALFFWLQNLILHENSPPGVVPKYLESKIQLKSWKWSFRHMLSSFFVMSSYLS